MSREKMALSEEAIRWGFEKYAPNSLLEDVATVTLSQCDELMAWVAGITSFNLGWRTGNFGLRVSLPAARRGCWSLRLLSGRALTRIPSLRKS